MLYYARGDGETFMIGSIINLVLLHILSQASETTEGTAEHSDYVCSARYAADNYLLPTNAPFRKLTLFVVRLLVSERQKL